MKRTLLTLLAVATIAVMLAAGTAASHANRLTPPSRAT
jgi:hypothetical protein